MLWDALQEPSSHCSVLSLRRTAGAAPLLAWNRVMQPPNQFQPAQYQGMGPMGYPQRPEDRMDRGRQVGKRGPTWCGALCCPPSQGFPLLGLWRGSVAWAGIAELDLVSLCHHAQVGDCPALASPGTRPCWEHTTSVHDNGHSPPAA